MTKSQYSTHLCLPIENENTNELMVSTWIAKSMMIYSNTNDANIFTMKITKCTQHDL
jgi:hypothetical protein